MRRTRRAGAVCFLSSWLVGRLVGRLYVCLFGRFVQALHLGGCSVVSVAKEGAHVCASAYAMGD